MLSQGKIFYKHDQKQYSNVMPRYRVGYKNLVKNWTKNSCFAGRNKEKKRITLNTSLIKVPEIILELHHLIALAIEILFVNNLPFFTTMS